MPLEPGRRRTTPAVERARLVQQPSSAREDEEGPLAAEPADGAAREIEGPPVLVADDEQHRSLDAAQPAPRVLEPRRAAADRANVSTELGGNAERGRRAGSRPDEAEREHGQIGPLPRPPHHALEAQGREARFDIAVTRNVVLLDAEIRQEDGGSGCDEPPGEPTPARALTPAALPVRDDDERSRRLDRKQQVGRKQQAPERDRVLAYVRSHTRTLLHGPGRDKHRQ